MKSTIKGVGRIALGLAASAVLGWFVVRGLDWGVVWESIQGVSWPLLVPALIVFIFASVVRAFRWQLLFTDERISLLRLFIIQNEGIGLNNLVPVRIVSEATQLAVLSLRDGVRWATALATLGMERVLDLVASAVILAIAIVFVDEVRHFTPYVLGIVAISVAAVAAVRFLAWGSDAVTFLRRIPLLASFTQAVRDLEQQRLRLAASLGLSFFFWVLVGVTAWIVAMATSVPISPTVATLVILSAIFFATSVPGAPSAIGTFEFAVVYVLGYFGMEREAGFGFAVITHVVFFLPSTIIAALFLPREGIGSLRRIRQSLEKGAGVGNDSSG